MLNTNLKDPNVARHVSYLHDKYIVVPTDRFPNKIVFVCISHYINCLINDLCIDYLLGNSTFTPTTLIDQTVGISMCFYFAPLLVNSCLYTFWKGCKEYF